MTPNKFIFKINNLKKKYVIIWQNKKYSMSATFLITKTKKFTYLSTPSIYS